MSGSSRHGKAARLRGAAMIAAALALLPVAAMAQGIGLPGQDPKMPLEINAEDGIEWRRDTKAYIARGNASAVQGDVTVYAEVLTAYYHELPTGGSKIWRIDAVRNVRIVSPTQTAYGDKGVYDIEKGILVLTGRVRLITETDQISARDSLEFWEKRGLAVARGDAVAVRGENRLRADILTAHMSKGKDGKSRITRIDAFDQVLISTPGEIARGDQGVYNVETGIAVLTGSVKITRGGNQLYGEYAEINLNTGVSRLFSSGKQGVKGYFSSDDVRNKTSRGQSGPSDAGSNNASRGNDSENR